jgi:hypothetical protein
MRVAMEEQPSGGLWERMRNRVMEAPTVLRNAHSLRRLRQLAEVRASVVHR